MTFDYQVVSIAIMRTVLQCQTHNTDTLTVFPAPHVLQVRCPLSLAKKALLFINLRLSSLLSSRTGT